LDLSEQELIDCDSQNYGCVGGSAFWAFNYVAANNLTYEEYYPYKPSGNKLNCSKDAVPNRKLNSVGCKPINLQKVFLYGNETKLKEFVRVGGPIAIYFDATQKLSGYRSGIFFDETCTPGSVNHLMVVVGYGTSAEGIDYW
jgi:hypothetical protein